MNGFVKFTTFLVFASSAGIAAATEYKCHVKDANNGEQIVLVDTFSLQDAERAAGDAKLPGLRKNAMTVSQVFECRLETGSFGSARARALDIKTPR